MVLCMHRHHKTVPNLLSGFVFSVSCCSVPWFLNHIDIYKGHHGVEPCSICLYAYIRAHIYTYTLLSGRRFLSFMTGDGHWNEDGDNPTHMLPMVTRACKLRGSPSISGFFDIQNRKQTGITRLGNRGVSSQSVSFPQACQKNPETDPMATSLYKPPYL